jgi:Hint domain
MLIATPETEMLFGEHEVLVAALHLVGRPGITRIRPADLTPAPASALTADPAAALTYVHLLFDRHEILPVDGTWSESFQPALRMISGMDQAARDELLTLFPELQTTNHAFPAARLTLKAHEARVLIKG